MRADINKPRGLAWPNRPVPKMETLKVWNIKNKFYEYDAIESKTTFYRGYPFENDGKGDTFEKGNCRVCLKKITSYKEKFYKEVFQYNVWNSEELSEETDYCKECAATIAEKVISYGWNPALSIKEKYMTLRDDEWVEHIEYDDGSCIDECTSRELPEFAKGA